MNIKTTATGFFVLDNPNVPKGRLHNTVIKAGELLSNIANKGDRRRIRKQLYAVGHIALAAAPVEPFMEEAKRERSAKFINLDVAA